jgi:protein-S-isoprenylcysteine O-methyltransferase Ste14
MLNTIALALFLGFTAYRALAFYLQTSAHAKRTKDVPREYSDIVGSHGINVAYAGVYLSVLYAWYNFGLSTPLIFVALFFTGCAWWVRLQAIPALGENYGHEIKIFENHTLSKNGIYASVRHPLYTGLLIDTFVVALMGNVLIAWGFWLCFAGVVTRRIALEDQKLLELFGDEARDYQATTPSINIFQSIYSFKKQTPPTA